RSVPNQADRHRARRRLPFAAERARTGARAMTLERPWRDRLRGKLPALSVRWRLTLWYLMILSLVMLVFGGLIYETQATSIRSQLNDDLRRQADQIAASFNPTTQQFDLGGAETQLGTPKALDAGEEA